MSVLMCLQQDHSIPKQLSVWAGLPLLSGFVLFSSRWLRQRKEDRSRQTGEGNLLYHWELSNGFVALIVVLCFCGCFS